MKALQFIFCLLTCFCIAAAVMVALMVSFWYACIPGVFVIVFGVLTIVVTRRMLKDEKKSGPFRTGVPVSAEK